MEFKKPKEYKSISTSQSIIKEKENCGTTCNKKVCFCGKI